MPEKKSPPRWFPWLLFAVFFLVSLGFQVHSGAWQSDFGGHADEGAHVVTSLMVRDYIAGGFLETCHPMGYAEAYYEKFPKVALGHYPPGFYLVLSIGLLPFREGETFLVIMSLLAAGAGWLVWWFGRRLVLPGAVAVAIALLYILLPQTRTYTAIVMADLLLVIFSLLAARSFLRFLEMGKAGDSLWFGCWAAGAILTKGSAVGLALLPPLAILFSGEWRVVLKPSLWLAPLPVILFAVPWMLLTMGITQEGMRETSLFDWCEDSLPFYAKVIEREVGWILLLVLGWAAGVAVIRAFGRRQPLPLEVAVLWALLVCAGIVPLLVPAGLDARYLMPLIPACLLLGVSHVGRFAGSLSPRLAPLLLLMLAAGVFVETYRPVQKFYTGATPVIGAILEKDLIPGGGADAIRVLAVSDATGEGALVAAAALHSPEDLVMERGSKFLASSDWMGRGYATAYRNSEELTEALRSEKIDFIVLDPPPEMAPPHWKSLDAWLGEALLSGVKQVDDITSWRREVESRFKVFRVSGE